MKNTSLFVLIFAIVITTLSLNCTPPPPAPSTATNSAPSTATTSNSAASSNDVKPGIEPLGYIDEVNCNGFSGWAVNLGKKTDRVEVSVLIDGQFYMKTIANVKRDDIAAAGYSDGNSGWKLPAPAQVKDGKAHTVTASVNGKALGIHGSNQITCPASK